MGDLDRIVIVGPSDGTSYLNELYRQVGRPVPAPLASWESQVDDWCSTYRAHAGAHRLVEIYMGTAVFVFDQHDQHERVVLAYGVSRSPAADRDAVRMRRFPDVNVGVGVSLGDAATPFDRGHFLSHAAGGGLDINLFPHERSLNRGWSSQGKQFRQLEALAASSPETFHYHRPIYEDATWIPAELEYGVLDRDADWMVARLANRSEQ